MSSSRVGDASRGASAPEGVVILGMHRSGTSLVTRLVNMLGLAVCRHDDLIVGRARNPRGHWESKSLVGFNDRLLAELGCSWFCPPALQPPDTQRLLRKHASEAATLLHDAHPTRPWVWKDPRTCVLLPFWSAVLEQRAAYVLIARHPFEVSQSLQSRNGCKPLLNLALWERYTRQAMLGVAGQPVMACTYDGVLADPVAWCERLGTFLCELGIAAHPVDRLAVEAFVMNELRHSSRSWSDLQPGPHISPQQVELAQAANTFTAQRSYVPPALPAETPRTTELFEEIVRLSPGRRGLSALPPSMAVVKRSSVHAGAESWPPVSVVLARSDRVTVERALAALGDSLPSGSELLIVGADARERASVERYSRSRELALRPIECEHPPSEAEALALGSQHAGGRLVLLASGRLTRIDPWYPKLRLTLSGGEVGGVGPVMRFHSNPHARHFGRVFDDEDLTIGFLAGSAEGAVVSAALLSSAHCLLIRGLLAAAGGVDREFSSASAAVAELSVRLWRMGFHCSIHPGVEAWGPRAEEDVADTDGEGGEAAGGEGAGEAGGDAAGASAAAGAGAGEDAAHLHDRMRIAALHFGPERLQAFTQRASRLPAYQAARERLDASDVDLRRVKIEAVCAFPIERYFESFPPGHTQLELPATARRSPLAPLGRLRRRLRSR